MIVLNSSTKRSHGVGGVIIYPGTSMNVPDQYYDDITGISDLSVTSGAPADGGKNYAKQPAVMQGGGTIVDVSGIIVVSSEAAVDADGQPDGTIHYQVS